MPLEPHNPFYRSLAEIEDRLPGERLGAPIEGVGTILQAGFEQIAKILQGLSNADLVCRVDDLAKAQQNVADAVAKVAQNTEPSATGKLTLGCALLVLLLDRDGNWDERFDVAMRLKKLLAGISGGNGDPAALGDDADPSHVDQLVRRAPGILRPKAGRRVDPLFADIEEEDVERFCRLLPTLLRAMNKAPRTTPPPDDASSEPSKT